MDRRDCESVRYGTAERTGVPDDLPTSGRSEDNGSWDQKEEMGNQHGRNLQNSEEEKPTFKIGYWNIAGLLKKDRDLTKFWEFIEHLDVIGLTETWVEEKHWKELEGTLSKEFHWKCNGAVKEKSKGRAIGGIITGVKKWITEEEAVEQTKNIYERIIRIRNAKWRILTVYSNKKKMKETRDDLQTITNGSGGEMLIIGGDFNARTSSEGSISPKDEDERRERRSKDKLKNPQGTILIKMAEEKGWDILNGNIEGDEEGELTFIGAKGSSGGEQGDTAKGKSVIDYVMTNSEVRPRVKKCTVENISGSDHLPTVVELYKYAASENQKAEKEIWTEEEKRKNQEEKNRIDFEEMKVNDTIDPTQTVMKVRNKIGESSQEEYTETEEEIQSLTNEKEIGRYIDTETASLREEIGLIPETQAGFRSGRSAKDYILNIARRELQVKGSTLYTFCADLKAPFDNVNREKLNQLMEEEAADLEEYMKEGQSGVAAIGNRKIWTLVRADGIVLIAKTRMELQEMIKRLKTYLLQKDLMLNEEKSKVVVYKKRRGKEKENEGTLREEDIERKEFKYLEYVFKKKRRTGGTRSTNDRDETNLEIKRKKFQ